MYEGFNLEMDNVLGLLVIKRFSLNSTSLPRQLFSFLSKPRTGTLYLLDFSGTLCESATSEDFDILIQK